MGVIYGYISLTDKPVTAETMEAMRKANSFWNPDGDGLWHDTHAGLGSLILFNTPEAIFESQPLQFENNQKVLVATARIDNRDELCRVFDIPLSARDLYPDSYYIRLAYEKWGEACPDHLLGDWCFAIWDKENHKLFIARDHHGISALYYYKGPDFFVFSSSLKGILCLPQVEKKVNEFKIAQILVNWNEGGPQTCYLDIFRLPPAHTLSLENNNVTTNRYWYLEHTPEIRLKNDEAYVEMFRELYTEAVRCRLRSYRPVGATLSGGLDSGSVCILAAQELAKYGKRLPAFTAVPLYDVPWPKNRIGNEGPLALSLAEKLGNVDVTLCKAENISPLEGVEKMLDYLDEPGTVVMNSFWITDILAKCKCANVGTLLIGQNGNNTVSWTYPNYLILWKNFLSGYFFLNLNNKIIRKPEFVTKPMRPFSLSTIKQRRIKNLNPASAIYGDRWKNNSIHFNLETRDPLADIRLMSFLISIPYRCNYFKSRLFINFLFQNYFPKIILNNKIRGIQSIDIKNRLNTDLVLKEIKNNVEYLKKLEKYISLSNLFTINGNQLDRYEIRVLLKLYSLGLFINQNRMNS